MWYNWCAISLLFSYSHYNYFKLSLLINDKAIAVFETARAEVWGEICTSLDEISMKMLRALSSVVPHHCYVLAKEFFDIRRWLDLHDSTVVS